MQLSCAGYFGGKNRAGVTMQAVLDEERLNQFVGKMFGDLGGAASADDVLAGRWPGDAALPLALKQGGV